MIAADKSSDDLLAKVAVKIKRRAAPDDPPLVGPTVELEPSHQGKSTTITARPPVFTGTKNAEIVPIGRAPAVIRISTSKSHRPP